MLEKYKKAIIIGGSALFIILNSLAIANEFFLIPLLSFAAILIYLLIYRVDILMYLLAFSTPFSVLLENDKIQIGVSLPAEIIMISITLLFICRICYDLTFHKKLLKHPVTIAVFAYLTWMLITCISSEYPLVSFKFLAAKIWFIVSSYFMVIQLMQKDIHKWITFFNCYAVALATVVIITTIKHAMTGFGDRIAHWIMSPFYNDHTAYGAILAFFIPITFGMVFLPKIGKAKRTLYILLTIIFIVGLYLSYSRAAWLSLIGAIAIWSVLKLRIKFSWFIVGIALIGTFFFCFADDILYRMSRNSQDSSGNLAEQLQSISNISTDASNVERLNRWQAAFRMIEARPIVGWGPGTYQFAYAPFQDSRYKTIITTNLGDGGNAHSEYIGPCAETGFVGLATVLALMIFVLYYGITTYTRSKSKTVRVISLSATLALITYYIHGTMNNFLDTDKLSLPFWGAFAIIVVLNCYYTQYSDKQLDSTKKNDDFPHELEHPNN